MAHSMDVELLSTAFELVSALGRSNFFTIFLEHLDECRKKEKITRTKFRKNIKTRYHSNFYVQEFQTRRGSLDTSNSKLLVFWRQNWSINPYPNHMCIKQTSSIHHNFHKKRVPHAYPANQMQANPSASCQNTNCCHTSKHPYQTGLFHPLTDCRGVNRPY